MWIYYPSIVNKDKLLPHYFSLHDKPALLCRLLQIHRCFKGLLFHLCFRYSISLNLDLYWWSSQRIAYVLNEISCHLPEVPNLSLLRQFLLFFESYKKKGCKFFEFDSEICSCIWWCEALLVKFLWFILLTSLIPEISMI